MISESALRGYVLEELIAKLLQASGYDLLVEAAQDPNALVSASNGLQIRGRGANHQVDVLGQLQLKVQFSYPIRLFVEAKYRSAATGLEAVRNALGVVNDVNEHYSSAGASAAPSGYERYLYKYALFSASGFTRDALDYAVTQQISLVDLSQGPFRKILATAARLASALIALAVKSKIERFPVNKTREALRRALGTWPGSNDDLDASDLTTAQTRARARARARASESPRNSSLARFETGLPALVAMATELDEKLYLAFVDTPFVVVLKPDDPLAAAELFRTDFKQRPADIDFVDGPVQEDGWAVTVPVEGRRVTFRMGLSKAMESLIFSDVRADEDARRNTKRRIDRSLTVAVEGGGVELEFPLVSTSQRRPVDREDDLRSKKSNQSLAYRDDESDTYCRGHWTREAAFELIFRLESEGAVQAQVIEFAARNKGTVSRSQVQRIANFPTNRTLRGFTRPPKRIADMLINELALPPDVEMPLQTRYSSGVLASHFVVPSEFSTFFN